MTLLLNNKREVSVTVIKLNTKIINVSKDKHDNQERGWRYGRISSNNDDDDVVL